MEKKASDMLMAIERCILLSLSKVSLCAVSLSKDQDISLYFHLLMQKATIKKYFLPKW